MAIFFLVSSLLTSLIGSTLEDHCHHQDVEQSSPLSFEHDHGSIPSANNEDNSTQHQCNHPCAHFIAIQTKKSFTLGFDIASRQPSKYSFTYSSPDCDSLVRPPIYA